MFVFVSIFVCCCCCCCSPPCQTRHEYSAREKNLLKFVAKLCLWPKWQIAKLIVHIFFVQLNAHALHGKLNRDIIVTCGEQLLQFASPPHVLPPPTGVKVEWDYSIRENGATYSWDYNASNADAYSGSLEQAIAQIHAVPERDEVTFDLQRSNSLIWGKHKKKIKKKFKFLRRLSSLPIAPSSHSAINLRRVRCIASSGSTSGRCDAKMTCDKADLLYFAQADL